MKKILGLVAAAGLMFGISGQALAGFTQNHLVMATYSYGVEKVNEVAIDLGSFDTINFSGTNVTLAEAGRLSLSNDFVADWSEQVQDVDGDGNPIPGSYHTVNHDGIDSWSDNLRVLYFGGLDTTTDQRWFGSTESSSQGIYGGTHNIPFTTAVNGFYNTYDDISTKVNVADTTGYLPSTTAAGKWDYVNAQDPEGTPGNFHGYLKTTDFSGYSTLAGLDDVGYVDMYLYHYSGSTLQLGNNGTTDYTAVIRLNDDGSVVLNPAVPIPASVLLFGSGLLGLFGIRRKRA